MIFFLSLVSQNNLFIVWVMFIYHFKLSIFRLFSTWWESHRNSRFLAMLFETIILLFLLELLLDRVLKRDKVILYVHTTKILLYASSKKLSWKRKSWSFFFWSILCSLCNIGYIFGCKSFKGFCQRCISEQQK